MNDTGADWAAIRAAFEPLRATGRLARFRVLDVRCEQGHRLLQVIGTIHGPIICSRSEAILIGSDGNPAGWKRRAVHDEIPLDAWPHPTYTAQCRCRTAVIPVAWLRHQLDTGTHRAEWTDHEGHSQ